MFIRNSNLSDVVTLASFNRQDFGVPNLNGPYVLAAKTISTHKDGIIAAGIVRATTEGILVIDESQPLVTRVNVIQELIRTLRRDISRIGYDECHVFANAAISPLLRKLNFVDCKGTPMVLQWQNENVKK